MKKYITCILSGLLLLNVNLSVANDFTSKKLKIRFAMEATYPPFESVDSEGNIVGFDIDIANAICQKIDAECSFVNSPWGSLIPGLRLGKFDAVISALAITHDRKKQVAFSNPYYFDTASFVQARSNPVEISATGLNNKNVGVQGGSSMENYMLNIYKDTNVDVKTYASIAEAFLDLKSGRVDVVLADTPIAQDWIKRLSPNKFELSGKPINDPTYFGEGLGIAVNKNNSALLKKINDGLKAIQADGTYASISAKYFGHPE